MSPGGHKCDDEARKAAALTAEVRPFFSDSKLWSQQDCGNIGVKVVACSLHSYHEKTYSITTDAHWIS